MFSDVKLFESRCKFIPGEERQGYFAERRTLNAEYQMTLKLSGKNYYFMIVKDNIISKLQELITVL